MIQIEEVISYPFIQNSAYISKNSICLACRGLREKGLDKKAGHFAKTTKIEMPLGGNVTRVRGYPVNAHR